MGRSLDEVLNSLPEDRRKRIQREAEKDIREYETLQTIRKDLGLTQQDVACALEIKQNNVSDLEKRTDMKLSTLRNYLHALGGELVISARFPDQDMKIIENLSD